MKIYINGRFLTQSITGVQRYAREVVETMDILLSNSGTELKNEYQILVPRNTDIKIRLNKITIREVGFLQGHLWEQFELPAYAHAHLLINFCNVAPIFKKKQMVTIHDASIYMQQNNFSKLFKMWYKIIYKLEIKHSMKIITVSKFSEDELIKYTKIDPNKLSVIYEGTEHIDAVSIDTEFLKKYQLLDKPYALAVSSMDPRKNFSNIIRAMEKLGNDEFNLVIAGGTNPRIFNSINISLPKNVKYLGYVSDEQLKALYKHAFCFVYPSFYEGFGLPPLEAMSVGCPVIVSDRASLPEICGKAAKYCNPDDPTDIANKINQIYRDKERRKQYVKDGLERAKMFSWKQCAKEMLNLCERLATEHK